MNKTILTAIGIASVCGPLVAQTQLANKITSDTTLEAGNEYLIDGYTYVMPGATLTIEPGVTIYAAEGTGASASALVVTRGASINAVGTAVEPIVFTPISSKTATLGPDDSGMWGGVIILGNGILNSNKSGSFTGDYPTQDVEGMVPATGDESLINYGGSDSSESSGTFRYVSIRHGGTVISEGNEINGLTLGGVGSGTTIDHVEVFGNKDDAIEIFGGAVNLDYIVAAFSYDDSLDLDEGWQGQVQHFFAIQRKGGEGLDDKGDKGGEWDGNDKPATREPLMLLQLANATFVGMGTEASNTAINIRANGAAEVYNSLFVEYNKMLQIDKDSDEATLGRFNDGDIKFEGNLWYSSTAANNTVTGLAVAGDSYVAGLDAFFSGTNQIVDPGLTVSRTAGSFALDVTPAADSAAITAGTVNVPAGLAKKSYRGAFDTYYNWATGWTKLYEDGYFVMEGTWFEHPKWGWMYLNSGALEVASYVYFQETDQWVWLASEDDTGFWTYLFR
ncbi:MAG: hypothetical protein JW942_09440 [Opitutales bacterium]|nr:hypothetical protein [Opitutales bacterium]